MGTVKVVGNTVSDAGNAMGNGIIGGVYSAMAAGTPKDHPARQHYRKKGKEHLKKAKHQTSGALVGELKINASINANISKPYNITLSSVSTDYKITRGIGALIVSPILAAIKSDVRQAAVAIIQTKMGELFDKLRNKVKNIDFVQDEQLNECIQSVWEPQNITARFTQNNGLRLTLNSEFVTWLIQQIETLNIAIPNKTIDTTLQYKNVGYAVKIIIDFNGRNIYAEMYGIGGLVNTLNNELKSLLKNKIGKGCYQCNTSISPSNTNVSVSAVAFLRVPL